MVTVPFSFLPPKILERLAIYFMGMGKSLNGVLPYLQIELDRADVEIKAQRYLALCLSATFFLFLFLVIVLTIFFSKNGHYVLGASVAFLFSLFVFFLQLQYPKVLGFRRIKKLDVDLLAALRTIMIQLNSGVPLFETMVMISKQEFGEVSNVFRKTVEKINAGVPQIEALESMAFKNPSPYFRRTIWQIINGMKSGAAINLVVADVIKNLTKEQIIQIEQYGSELNPVAMFYMMFAVIMPALGITFISVIASFIDLSAILLKSLFWGLLVLVIFLQLMFSGVVKSKRPSLLGE